MTFLIAGLGSIGRRHFKNLVALGENDIILYRTNRSTLADEELAGFPVEHDLERALEHKPDAVIVSNPSSLHLDVAIPCARAGCHLLLEKPVSHTMDRIQELSDAVIANGVRILVAFQFRFHPTIAECRRQVTNGAIGTPLYARAHWGEYLPDWHPWEDHRIGYAARKELGGGVILTLSHPLDYLRWILGEATVRSAVASTAPHLGLEVDSCAEIGVSFEKCPVGSVHLNFVEKPARHFFEIVGTDGTLKWSSCSGELTLIPTGVSEPCSWGVPAGYERNMMFVEEMKHFLSVVRGEATAICSLTDGVKALEIAWAAQRMAGFN